MDENGGESQLQVDQKVFLMIMLTESKGIFNDYVNRIKNFVTVLLLN